MPGALFGVILCILLFGPVRGILAVMAYYFFKEMINVRVRSHTYKTNHAQTAFFRAIFIVMGRLAKIDGHVNEQEIKHTSHLMDTMNLTTQQRQQAVDFFTLGKSGTAIIHEELQHFKQSIHSSSLAHVFLEFLLQLALSDGPINREEDSFLKDICISLNISQFTYDIIKKRIIAQQQFYSNSSDSYQNHHTYRHERTSVFEFQQACKVLNIATNASKQEAKASYRKLMNQHHPDKLVSKGLPKEMLDVAKEKTQDIQKAWDVFQKYKNT